MHYLIFSIVCSVAVSILLKISKKQSIEIDQAVAINYPTAAICAFILFQPNTQHYLHTLAAEWHILLPLAILLPTVFIIMGVSVRQAGIAKSDAAQRVSLFLPIVAAFLIFDETLRIGKIIAVVLAFIALL
ncbi:MAG: EamA/RhaT family transporter, partial [Neisseriaceae bacterium]|nr:EamA/RhaT family transporter [Neisseriaceae bacterium]